MESLDELVDLVSADFPQARVDQLERLCELVRAEMPRLGELTCALRLTRRLADGVRTLASRPSSVQPALLARELGDGGAEVGASAATASASGASVAAELAALLHIDMVQLLTQMPRAKLAAALRDYLPEAPTDASAVQAGVREVLVEGGPLDDDERMAAVPDDDDDDNGAFSEPFAAPPSPPPVADAARLGAHQASAAAAAEGGAPEWADLHARLASLARHASYAALAALPPARWAGADGVGARVCALVEAAAARARERGSRRLADGASVDAAEPCACLLYTSPSPRD